MAQNTALPKQKRCCTDTLPVSGFHQPSLCMWMWISFFLSGWIWIQGDVLNPHKCRHINACKRTHTHTHHHPLLRALPRRKVPLWFELQCELNCCGEYSTLFTNSHQLPAEERDSDGCACECAEGKWEKGGLPSLTVSVGKLKTWKVKEEDIKRQKKKRGEAGCSFQNREKSLPLFCKGEFNKLYTCTFKSNLLTISRCWIMDEVETKRTTKWSRVEHRVQQFYCSRTLQGSLSQHNN